MPYQEAGDIPYHDFQEPREDLVFPSTEWAWTLGVLSLGGYITKYGRIIVSNRHSEFVAAFKSRGQRLFKVNGVDLADSEHKSEGVAFNLKGKTVLGNLNRNEWMDTIQREYPWIVQQNKYLWSFVEGMLETRGTLYSTVEKDDIQICTTYRNEATYIAELLVRLGIDNPKIKNNRKTREGVQGVVINTPEDLTLFCSNIHSVISERDERLKDIAKRNAHRESGKHINFETVAHEWYRIFRIVGHVPHAGEINLLHTMGLTPWSLTVYMQRFGNMTWEKMYPEAKEKISHYLRNLTLEETEELQKIRDLYKSEKLRRAHEGEKRHRRPLVYSDEDLIHEWIAMRSELGRVPTYMDLILFRNNGQLKCSPRVFEYRFGSYPQCFASARDTLEKIIVERTKSTKPFKNT